MTSDETRLVRLCTSTAVQLLETQDGILFPIAHAIDAGERVAFIGAYNGAVVPNPTRALEAVRHALRARAFRSVAVVYGLALRDAGARNRLCIEFESLDAAPQTIFIPFVITRPWLRQARVVTYAPTRTPGQSHVLGAGLATRALP